jgi:tetratricopeptide (TPR) repeat protein
MLVSDGMPQQALEPLSLAVARNDSHNEAHEALARALLQLGRLQEALDLTTRWQAVNSDSAAALRMLAWAQFQSGKLKEADSGIAQSVKADPGVAESWRLRAMISFARGESKSAFSALERANKLDPKDPETFCEIGRGFLRQGHPDNASAAFAAAVREKPGSICGQVGQIWSRSPGVGKAEVKDLEQLSRQAVAVWDRSFALAALARGMAATGQAKGARARAQEAITLAPWSGDAHLAVGLVAERLRDGAAAKDAFTKAVELDPSHSGFVLVLADALARGKSEDLEQAVREYERFLRMGGSERDEARVKRTLTTLKRRLASR